MLGLMERRRAARAHHRRGMGPDLKTDLTYELRAKRVRLQRPHHKLKASRLVSGCSAESSVELSRSAMVELGRSGMILAAPKGGRSTDVSARCAAAMEDSVGQRILGAGPLIAELKSAVLKSLRSRLGPKWLRTACHQGEG